MLKIPLGGGGTELVKTEEHMKFRHIDGAAIWDKKRIEWKYKEPLKDDQNIQDLEEYAEINLPADYTAFIREHNGATPKPRVLRLSNGRNVVLNRLLRVEADEIDNIKDCMDALRNTHRVANLLPFADDPFGNLFCFECSRQEMKGIVFWDHEKNDTVKICTTFTELVDNLCDEEA